jgi:hypothetical protein
MQFDRAMRGGSCHVPRAGHTVDAWQEGFFFAICASVIKKRMQKKKTHNQFVRKC